MVKAQATKDLNSIKNYTDIADNTAQHFWFNGEGLDTGAHITEVPQEEWSDSTSGNYHKGPNLLARSNGIALRDGMTELAKFSSSGAQIGQDSGVHGIFTSNALDFYTNTTKCAELSYSEDLDSSNWRWFLLRQQKNDVGAYGSGIIITADRGITSPSYNKKYIGSTLKMSPTDGFDLQFIPSDVYSDYQYRGTSGGLAFVSSEVSGGSSAGHLALLFNEVNSSGTRFGGSFYLGVQGNYRCSYAEIIADEIYVRGTFYNYSDRKLKEHIKYIGDEVVDLINSLQPALYTMGRTKNVGFYAQDVEAVDPWECLTSTGSDDMKMLSYEELIAPLVKYCQLLEERVRRLEK